MKKYLLPLLAVFSFTLLPQFSLEWVSDPISYNKLSGWLNYEKQGEKWHSRLYTLDSTKFEVMGAGYSTTPAFSYTFTEEERLAGGQLFSLKNDLNNNNFADAYVLAYNGTSTNYRQSFKIIDLASGEVLMEKNDPAWYYSYPTLADVNNDGYLELVVLKYEYPLFANYFYEVYSLGFAGIGESDIHFDFKLGQNYPNPFNPETKIEFSLGRKAAVNLEIYDVSGKKVRSLVNGEVSAGAQSVVWDGKNDAGLRVPTGVYFYTLKTGEFTESKKMILLK
ncbi:MAG: T9SS type A sorting domain-containing protein [Ignavibacteriales bacterium]|nr:hypothetical protein [Ignavibacteriaceae bacterium]MBW7874189.1 T9SS type A sorting domain-containing protein [Ignavibacteria bacterium]MBZ0197871.1 T9SS type A sorting domain-containing protein [Ignavibacteriaceae bacterium]MCZ2142964.1 T9SS type A sorting domain-containing protein [Ignavibacteriales bacterium]WKZ72069.1 MAG: FlgD immunoglobulin-like domain containing protein [Ignavibacteriaceae bacterium]